MIFEGSTRSYASSIRGFRVEAAPSLSRGERVACWRCGQTMPNHVQANLIPDAPCADCREYLREEEGELTVWDSRRNPEGVRVLRAPAEPAASAAAERNPR